MRIQIGDIDDNNNNEITRMRWTKNYINIKLRIHIVSPKMTKKQSIVEISKEDQAIKDQNPQSTLRRLNLMSRQLICTLLHLSTAGSEENVTTNRDRTELVIQRRKSNMIERTESIESSDRASSLRNETRRTFGTDCCLALIGAQCNKLDSDSQGNGRNYKRGRRRSKVQSELEKDCSSKIVITREKSHDSRDSSIKENDRIRTIKKHLNKQSSFDMQITTSSGSAVPICREPISTKQEPISGTILLAAQSSSLNIPSSPRLSNHQHQYIDDIQSHHTIDIPCQVQQTKNRSIGVTQFSKSKRQNSDRLSQLLELLDKIGDRNRQVSSRKLQDKSFNGCDEINKQAAAAAAADMFELENNWTDLVHIPTTELGARHQINSDEILSKIVSELNDTNNDPMSDIQRLGNLRTQQDAIWELVRTELFYIKGLKAIIDVFLSTLNELQQNSFLIEIEPSRLMSNIEDIYQANSWFWLNYIHPMLTRSRINHSPLDPTLIRNAFVQLRQIFHPYYRYCLELTDCLSYLKNQSKTNEHFRIYVAWCESRKDCDRLKLMDLLAKPTQRITRYSLLLKAIAKRSDSPDHLAALEQMISETDRFVLTVDLELRRRDDLNQLIELNKLIESFESGLADPYNNDEIEQLVRLYNRPFDLTEPIFNCPFQCHRQLIFDSSYSPIGCQNLCHTHSIGHQVVSPRPESMGKRLSPGRQDNKHPSYFKFRDAQSNCKLDIIMLLFTDQLLICRQVSGSSTHNNHTHSKTQNISLNQDVNHVASGSLGRLTGQHQSFGQIRAQFNSINLSPLPSQFCRSRTGSGGQRIRQNLHNQIDLKRQETQLENSHIQNKSAINLSARALSLILAPSGFNLTDDMIMSQSLMSRCEQQTSNNHTATGSIHSSMSSISARDISLQWSRSKSGPDAQSNCHNRSMHDQPFHSPASIEISSYPQGQQQQHNTNHTSNVQSSSSNIFGFSNQSSRSAKISTRYRVIRSPYPIDRLEMFELKDGKSVFFCLLSDSRTIVNSFVIHLPMNLSLTGTSNQDYQSPVSSRLRHQSCNDNTEQNVQQTAHLTSAGFNHQVDHQSKHHQSPKRQTASIQSLATPARQLINLIREAQLRMRLAADFHAVSLAPQSSLRTGSIGGAQFFDYNNNNNNNNNNSNSNNNNSSSSTKDHEMSHLGDTHTRRFKRWSFSGDLRSKAQSSMGLVPFPHSPVIRLDPQNSPQRSPRSELKEKNCNTDLDATIQSSFNSPKQRYTRSIAGATNWPYYSRSSSNEMSAEQSSSYQTPTTNSHMLTLNGNNSTSNCASGGHINYNSHHNISSLNHLQRSLIDQYRSMLWSHAHFDKLAGDDECLTQLAYLLTPDDSVHVTAAQVCSINATSMDGSRGLDLNESATNEHVQINKHQSFRHCPFRRFLSPRASRLSFRQAYGHLGTRRLNRKGLVAGSDPYRGATTSSSAGSADESWLLPTCADRQLCQASPRASSPSSQQISDVTTIRLQNSSIFFEPQSRTNLSVQLEFPTQNSVQNVTNHLANTRPLSCSATQLQMIETKQKSASVEPSRSSSRRHLNSLRRQNVVLMQSSIGEPQLVNRVQSDSDSSRNTSHHQGDHKSWTIDNPSASITDENEIETSVYTIECETKTSLDSRESQNMISNCKPIDNCPASCQSSVFAVTLTKPNQDDHIISDIDQGNDNKMINSMGSNNS